MKDKYPNHSTKNGGEKQEGTDHLNKQNKDKYSKSMSSSKQNMKDNHGMNDFFSHRDAATGNNASTRDHSSALFFGLSGGLGPDYTSQTKDGLGSGHTYKREEEKRTYLYGFTNSKFIYFLGTMDPRAYLVFVTLIALLILEDLNDYESKIVYAFLANVSDSMQSVIEQEIIIDAYNVQEAERAQNAALQKDFEIIYSEIDRLKKEMSQLKS